MLEAIVQSRWYPDHAEVDFMPAAPGEWSHGSVSGIRIRGGAEIGLQWDGGKARSSRWRTSEDEVFEIRLTAGQHVSGYTANGKTQKIPQQNSGAVRVALRKGATYEFAFD